MVLYEVDVPVTPAEVKPLSFRPIRYVDIPLFREWVLRPHVAQWWPDAPSIDEIEAWCANPTDGQREWHDIGFLDADPVGFIQTYVPIECHEEGWWLDEFDPGVRGIDQFLANADQLGQGLGTKFIGAFTDKLFANPSVTRIQCDPSPTNGRAIRCYEKAGFHAAGEIMTPDGPAMLMYLDRR